MRIDTPYDATRDCLYGSSLQTEWKGWHAFRRGLASNLNRLGIDDSVTQAILRHSDMSNHATVLHSDHSPGRAGCDAEIVRGVFGPERR
jgi:hypothetical protein